MIPRDSLINKLRALGYSYKDQQKRTDLYRRRGGTEIAFVPRTRLLTERYVRSILRQAGCEDADIEAFIGAYKR